MIVESCGPAQEGVTGLRGPNAPGDIQVRLPRLLFLKQLLHSSCLRPRLSSALPVSTRPRVGRDPHCQISVASRTFTIPMASSFHYFLTQGPGPERTNAAHSLAGPTLCSSIGSATDPSFAAAPPAG